MTAEVALAIVGALAFAAGSLLVIPSNWNPNVDDQGEAVAEKIVEWWHAYRSYRKIVSDEYSRHDGTQVIRNPRRYYSPPNTAPPSLHAVAVNRWFEKQQQCEPQRVGRHLQLVSA